jgi:hypothetical protein
MKYLVFKKLFPLTLLPACVLIYYFDVVHSRVNATGSLVGEASPVIQLSPVPGQCANLKSAAAIFGVTITKLEEASAAHKRLRALVDRNSNVPLVVRILFDPINTTDKASFEAELDKYQRAVSNLRRESGACVMGTIADSYYMYFYLQDQNDPTWPDGYGSYTNWTRRLVTKMDNLVDIWEIGNEVNGEWYGWKGQKYKKSDKQSDDESDDNQDPTMSEKRKLMRTRIKGELDAAFNMVRQLRPGGLTAVTLLYNADKKKDCTEFHEYKMNDWAGNYLTDNIKQNVDVVLLSYYENTQDCAQVTRSPDKLLKEVLVPLRQVFNSDQTAFGFGEISYKQNCYINKDDEYDDEDRNNHPECRAGEKDYVTRYYKKLDRDLTKTVDRYRPTNGDKSIKFVGGYFYWYFLQDMVLANNTEANPVYVALEDARRSFRNSHKPGHTSR